MKYAFFILLIICISCQKDSSPQKRSKPNFIIIFADDLGYGDLGCFGHPTIKTPNIDKMALEGMKLTQFYMAASLCTPSRAGLLTGRLPIRTGMCGKRGVLFPDSGGGLPKEETTIAEALKDQGYKTACIGKWHLGHLPEYLPTNHGFDYYFGIPYSNDMSPEQSNWEYARAAFPPTPLIENLSIIEKEPDQRQLTSRYTQKATEFIENQKDKPFFLYLAHTFPHVPLYVDELNKGKSKRGLYGDVIGVLDWSVGQILKKVRELRLEESTFVIFTSDNGPWGWAGINGGSAGLLKGKKGSPFEGGFRVPSIAWMPGSIPANTTSDAIGTSMDLFPTFINIANGNLSEFPNLDGKDISETFTKMKEIQQEVFYYRQDQFTAYRNGPWKIYLHDPNPWNDEFQEADMPLLYNLDEDPSETFNLKNEYPEVVERLTRLAIAHKNDVEKASSQLEIIQDKFREIYDEYN